MQNQANTACSYGTQIFLGLNEPKHLQKSYFSYIDFNIIISKLSTCFSIAVSTLDALHRTAFVNLSILANLRAALPRFW